MATNIKGPAIFLAQFAGDAAPFNTWDSITRWAASLGYKADTAQVDQKKFPKHTAEQKCSNCQLYQSKSPTAGSCAIFPGKLVAGPGWCNAYQKKA